MDYNERCWQMICLKCGKETIDENVFCQDCLQIMELYPVKPDTPVHLLQRPARSTEKQPSHKKEVSPQDTVKQLRLLVRCLAAVIAVLSVLLCITAGMLLQATNKDQPVSNIGRNYTTDTTAQP